MPNLDDELRRRMQRAGRRVDSDGLEGRLHARRAHKQITQKVGRGFLAVTVLAGSAFGVAGLNRAFRGDPGPADMTLGAGGTIAYMRQLRSCDGMTVDESSTNVVGLDLATGDLRTIRSTPLFTDPGRPLAERAPEFSPDGTKMAWADAYPYNLEVTDVASGQTQQVTHGLSVGAPHWSPDGAKLLFAAGERTRDPSAQSEFSDGPDAVYTMNPDGTDLQKLTDGTLPIWSPDGKIAFIRPGVTPLGPNVTVPDPGPTSFYVMNADGTGLDKVYEAPGDVVIRDAEWSPDGTKVVAEARFQWSVDIFVVDLGLRTAIQLTDDPTQDTSPTWSPDGTMIAFQTGRYGDETSRYGEDGHSEIAVMNADGSNVRRLTNDCVDDYNPTWLRNDESVRSLPVWHEPPPGAISCGRCSDATEAPPTPNLSGSCRSSSEAAFRKADFDGDGTTDIAELRCLDGVWDLTITWSGSDPLPSTLQQVADCGSTCSIFTAVDMDTDGAAELGIEIGGETARQVEFFRVGRGGAPTAPLTIVGDGAPGFPSNATAVFPTGGAVTHISDLQCEDRTDGRVLVSTTAESSSGSFPWAIRTTYLALDPDGFRVVSSVESKGETIRTGPFNEDCPPRLGN